MRFRGLFFVALSAGVLFSNALFAQEIPDKPAPRQPAKPAPRGPTKPVDPPKPADVSKPADPPALPTAPSAEALCTQAGGVWSGAACDTTKLQRDLARAACQRSGGGWNEADGSCKVKPVCAAGQKLNGSQCVADCKEDEKFEAGKGCVKPPPPAVAAAPVAIKAAETGPIDQTPQAAETKLENDHTLAWIVGGAGVVGIGVGTYFGLQAMSKKSDYQSHLGANGLCRDMECQPLSQDARTAGNMSTVAFLLGGALVGTGVVLWSIAPSGDSKVGRGQLIPIAGPQVAGLGMRGSW